MYLLLFKKIDHNRKSFPLSPKFKQLHPPNSQINRKIARQNPAPIPSHQMQKRKLLSIQPQNHSILRPNLSSPVALNHQLQHLHHHSFPQRHCHHKLKSFSHQRILYQNNQLLNLSFNSNNLPRNKLSFQFPNIKFSLKWLIKSRNNRNKFQI